MLRVITLNVNGIRSAAKKGFFDWMQKQHANVVCLQETKAQLEKLEGEIFRPQGFFPYFADAQKPGYSGVALYSSKKPDKVTEGFGWEKASHEGRYLQADFGKLSVISLYMPSGTTGAIRQAIKLEFMEHFLQHLKKLRNEKRHFIICGDWNIAHRTIDLKNWRANQKYSGFFPEERIWIDYVFSHYGWVDAFRVINSESDQYTWWSNRGSSWAKNVGWRIDYQIISPELKEKVKAVKIYKEQRFSDHAPLIMDYDVKF